MKVAEISTAIMKQRNNDLKKTKKCVTDLVNRHRIPAALIYLEDNGKIKVIGSRNTKKAIKKKKKKFKKVLVKDLKKLSRLEPGQKDIATHDTQPNDEFEKLEYPVGFLNINQARSALVGYIKISFIKKNKGKKRQIKYNGSDEYRPSWWRGSIEKDYPWSSVRNFKDHAYPGPGEATDFYRKCIRACLRGN